MTISPTRFAELLAKAKVLAAGEKDTASVKNIQTTQELIREQQPTDVDLSLAGIGAESLQSDIGSETAVEIIREIHSSDIDTQILQRSSKTTGVAADVTLNSKQQLFITTAMEYEDVCLIGAAGTGKTTVTGKFISRLIEDGGLKKLGVSTKWLREDVYGVLITSFTRKAVNNIRRAVPHELRPHVQTIHKFLEFAPVIYEVIDETTQQLKKTMRFEPRRTAMNPLPSSISLVVYEESSMIGTDLYNMMSAAMPHSPQEIFIGDIRQLPPIFGPAILGFKMSLLPVVELDEVYRQALLSGIIRLAHAVLSGNSRTFDAKIEVRKEKHPHTGNTVERKYVPSLEKFNCDDEYGKVKFQVWQKKLPADFAADATIDQFIAWEKNGYYNPDDDVIICPFNKSFGTDRLNEGISEYLGRKRGAVVFEVIAGFNKKYLAPGDRVLFDKEDAVVLDIRRNATYLGKSPQHPSVFLSRTGQLQQELSAVEVAEAKKEDEEFNAEAVDAFLDSFAAPEDDDEEGRVTIASHTVDIKFSYSDEIMSLSKAAEINALLGGYALTVHKMQGSENESIFFVLHHTHANMVNNELLYTGLSRARKKLHILCEVDSFQSGVKRHKVRGVTLADKIEFFKGKVEFKEMQKETEFLERQKEEKRKLREQERLDRDRQRQLEQEQHDLEYETDPQEQWENDGGYISSMDDLHNTSSSNHGLSPAVHAPETSQTIELPKPAELKEDKETPVITRSDALAALLRMKRR